MNNRKDHFATYDSLSSAFIGFTSLVRENGFNVGIKESQEGLKAAAIGTITNRNHFYYAIKAIYCQSFEETKTFDDLFNQFWGQEKLAISQKITKKGQSNILGKTKSTLVLMGWGEQDAAGEEDAKNVSGANATEKLRYTDFSKITQKENDELEKLAYQLWKQMSLRLKKKFKYTTGKGAVDIRKTIRRNLNNGGSLVELVKKNKKPQKNKLVMLLDVSGSMDKYSFFLLRFIWALKVNFKQVEVFLFSTKMVRATEYLNDHDLDNALALLSKYVDHWSGGTKIGECLDAFNKQYGKKVLNRRSLTIMLSDGLDTGDQNQLSEALIKIKKRTRQLIWLNPLKGMTGYEPTARGMKTALPYVDSFKSAHNLHSLLHLEKVLANV